MGCKNFLESLKKKVSTTKFLNASSSEIFANTKNRIDLNSKKKPISPYGKSKLMSLNLTKYYRDKFNLNCYNAILFNTESYHRNKEYLIPKICLAAIKAKNFKRKTMFGNLNISREWNWCEEQCDYLIKFLNNKPQDFILSNGKNYSAYQMINFAFKYFNLNYKKFVITKKQLFRKKDFLNKISNFQSDLKKNKLRRRPKVYGKSLVINLIKFYVKKKCIK